ncbi:hypothetical protein [Methylotenera sp.]|uniref:hypothetical protein n=1 Tax=Methylotenera sp. TaxID=2051956 RepID=UPI002ED999F9
MFFRVIVLSLLCTATSLGYASESECSKLASRVDNAEENYRPPLEAKVIGNSRLYFHNAPSSKCQVKGVFVIKGDSLTVYKSYDGWVNVMFIGKDGEDFIGWVQESKIKVIGQYGRNP